MRAPLGKKPKVKRHPVMLPPEVYEEIESLRLDVLKHGAQRLSEEAYTYFLVHNVTQVAIIRAGLLYLREVLRPKENQP